MRRLRFKHLLYSLLLISVVLKNVHPSSAAKSGNIKTTKSPAKSTTSTVATKGVTRSTTAKSSSRATSHPKGTTSSTKRTITTTTTTITPPALAEAALDQIMKLHYGGSSLSLKKKQNNKAASSSTTLSPIDIMNKIYQTHGMASHSSSSYTSYSHSSTEKKKEQSPSMDDIYRLHALAIAQAPYANKRKTTVETSSTTKEPSQTSSNTKQQQSYSQHNSMEHIYQQHSSLPSSMHHIMSQHSVQSHSSSSSRPQKTSSQTSQEISSSSLSTLMQPLLKQLTPVGAGISVVLAPLLLFNGFLTFFSNMSRFLNNFAQTILPVRRPIGQPAQNQNYFQNLGPAHLKRQPRDWLEHLQKLKDINDLTELILRAIKEAEME